MKVVESEVRAETQVEREFRLGNGRWVRLRPIRPDDAELLRQFVDGLSGRSRRLRFFGDQPPLDSELARTMSRVDFRDRMAFVAVPEDGARIVADCRLSRISNGMAEIAIAVADDCQGLGLGRALLEHVLAVAATAGFAQIVAQVRYDNERMIRLLRSLDFRRVDWQLGVLTFVWTPGAGTSTISPAPNDPPAERGSTTADPDWNRSRSRKPNMPATEGLASGGPRLHRLRGHGQPLRTLPPPSPLSPPGDVPPGGVEGTSEPARGRLTEACGRFASWSGGPIASWSSWRNPRPVPGVTQTSTNRAGSPASPGRAKPQGGVRRENRPGSSRRLPPFPGPRGRRLGPDPVP